MVTRTPTVVHRPPRQLGPFGQSQCLPICTQIIGVKRCVDAVCVWGCHEVCGHQYADGRAHAAERARVKWTLRISWNMSSNHWRESLHWSHASWRLPKPVVTNVPTVVHTPPRQLGPIGHSKLVSIYTLIIGAKRCIDAESV